MARHRKSDRLAGLEAVSPVYTGRKRSVSTSSEAALASQPKKAKLNLDNRIDFQPALHNESSAQYDSDARDSDLAAVEAESDTSYASDKSLGIPDMEDRLSLPSDYEEVEQDDGSIIVRAGGVSRAQVEEAVLKDERFGQNQTRKQRRFNAIIGRHFADSIGGRDKADHQIYDVVAWANPDHGARYAMKPSNTGEYEWKDGSYEHIYGHGPKYRPISENSPDEIIRVEPLSTSQSDDATDA